MSCITKPIRHGRSLRVHLKGGAATPPYHKTLCGILLAEHQEDIGPANCKRCLRSQAKIEQKAMK